MEEQYVSLDKIVTKLDVNKGDRLFISSDVIDLLYVGMKHDDTTDLNVLIDSLQEAVGEEGTLIFPTYNWDFCSGKDFDYNKTKSHTGSLSQAALNRKDFRRTKHPIYSFAVWGKDTEYLCGLDNVSSFGVDSPFHYFKEKNVKNLIINLELADCFTFTHHVEEMNREVIPYRYMKIFYGNYIDEQGEKTKRSYTMLVRSLAKKTEGDGIGFKELFLKERAAQEYVINGIEFLLVEFGKVYPIVERDIKQNHSKIICKYYEGMNGKVEPKQEMWMLVQELFPICRSITGNGFRNSLNICKSILPEIQVREVPTGTQVFDWKVPMEWNIQDAYIEDEAGHRILDFKENNLR
jgi:aminoglycoside 3-N-acetyltransferase